MMLRSQTRIAHHARRQLLSAAAFCPLSSASATPTSNQPNTNVNAAGAAQHLLNSFSNVTTERRQILDANQLQKLSLMLGRRQLGGADISENPPPAGTPLPPGWHLVYFTPNGLEYELGPDGTDRSFNATATFTRRMWAGGKMIWPAQNTEGGKDAPMLRIGDEVVERTRLVSAVPKKSKSGGEMVLVEVEKEFWGPTGLSVTDQRSWIFRPEVVPGSVQVPPSSTEVIRRASMIQDVRAADGREFPTRRFAWSPVGLFRFSALTFNAHMIHYNGDWTTAVEGHPAEVVHGPLNLINILDYWRDMQGQEAMPREISYRAVHPIYAREAYSIQTVGFQDAQEGKTWDIVAEKNNVTCMKSQILSS